MTITIAIANQKGGVGKTTIALAVATAVADLVKKRALLIDLDTQANATVGLGQRPQPGVAHWLLMDEPLETVIIPIRRRLDLVASNSVTDDVNLALANRAQIKALKTRLNGADYDYIVLDCPPSLAMITRAGLFAADLILTPIDCEFFALQGLVTLGGLIQDVQTQGSQCQWLGVIPNKYREVLVHRRGIARLKKRFGQYGEKFVWDPLPLTTQIARSQEMGQTIWTCEGVDKRHRSLWAAMVKRVLSYG